MCLFVFSAPYLSRTSAIAEQVLALRLSPLGLVAAGTGGNSLKGGAAPLLFSEETSPDLTRTEIFGVNETSPAFADF
jgi:hypothetical protein